MESGFSGLVLVGQTYEKRVNRAHYFTPYIHDFIFLDMNHISAAKTMDRTAGIENKDVSGHVSYKLAICPASRFPKKLDINHTPINIDMYFMGASLVTMDKPMGERQSSPVVVKKYIITSQSMLTGPVFK